MGYYLMGYDVLCTSDGMIICLLVLYFTYGGWRGGGNWLAGRDGYGNAEWENGVWSGKGIQHAFSTSFLCF